MSKQFILKTLHAKGFIYQVHTTALLYQVTGCLTKKSLRWTSTVEHWLCLHRCNIFCDYQGKIHQRQCMNIKVSWHFHVNVRKLVMRGVFNTAIYGSCSNSVIKLLLRVVWKHLEGLLEQVWEPFSNSSEWRGGKVWV